MTDDAPRPLTEEEQALAQVAKGRGGLCGRCGRALAEGEPVWIERVNVYGDGRAYWWVPVARECAPPALLSGTEGTAPERCAACGRGVYVWHGQSRRRMVTCSRRCRHRVVAERRKEARE